MKTILLFRDGTDSNAASLCRRLEEQGARIFATDQLAEARELLDRSDIDLVIINTTSGNETAKMVAEAAGAAGVRLFVLPQPLQAHRPAPDDGLISVDLGSSVLTFCCCRLRQPTLSPR